MNKLKYFLICLITIFQGCNGQTSPKTEIFNEEFKWKITIPENFQNVSVDSLIQSNLVHRF